MENVPTVTITLKEYQDLLKRIAFLDALEAAGVDNWSGIDCAYELLDPSGEED